MSGEGMLGKRNRESKELTAPSRLCCRVALCSLAICDWVESGTSEKL